MCCFWYMFFAQDPRLKVNRNLLGRLYARWQFQDYISTRAVQIVQPDLIQAGGIWESRKIAAMAESKSIGAQLYTFVLRKGSNCKKRC